MNRGRRLRSSANLRGLVRERRVSKDSLIYPLFFQDGENIMEEISSMQGQYRYSVDRISDAIDPALKVGVNKFILFGIPAEKDAAGSQAYAEEGIVQRALRAIKKAYGDQVYLITDVCMCEYTSHGHCGILKGNMVDNDATLPYLARIAISHVEAGADMIAPSDMMDGRIDAIREALDKKGYTNIPIMSYSAKYASSFYGPFRDAADSAPSFGDRKSYQMDYHNLREAVREASYDEEEGADIIMVKPAMSYLDVLREIRVSTELPIAAYSVSGEYSMIKAASKLGYIDEYQMMCETAISIFRAGADILITYYAKELANAIDRGDIG